ncbi:acyltransferase [Saccharicrinis aurantiacus]|uniref:acyltransferase n=1 Tax=Saccharicrinis aurantiacus TaxID=1849719 RepID=UPI00094FC3E8|nr:acyltransferase [Saccharicrinis aurantiacus]
MLYSLLQYLVRKIKGEKFSLDKNIPLSYYAALIVEFSIAFARGLLYFPLRKGKVFIKKSAVLKARSLINYRNALVINRGCYIDALSKEGIVFGDKCSVGKYTCIECTGSLQDIGLGLSVGDRTSIGSHSFLGCAGGVSIGNDVIMGNFVSIHSENHNFNNSSISIRKQGINRIGIKIGNNCWVGAKVTILDGVVVEDGCVIAAGALLTQGLYLSNGIYGGVPAKRIKNRC